MDLALKKISQTWREKIAWNGCEYYKKCFKIDRFLSALKVGP